MKKLLLSCLALSAFIVADAKISNATESELQEQREKNMEKDLAIMVMVEERNSKIKASLSKAEALLQGLNEAIAKSQTLMSTADTPAKREDAEKLNKDLIAKKQELLDTKAELDQQSEMNAIAMQGVTERAQSMFGNTCPKEPKERELLKRSAEATETIVNDNNAIEKVGQQASAAGVAVTAKAQAKQGWMDWILGKSKDCQNQ